MYRTDKQFMTNPATAGCRIYIGGLPKTTVAADLEEKFMPHGKVLGLVLQQGFAFVQYEEESQAHSAIDGENNSMMHGKKITVKQALDKSRGGPQQNRPQQLGQQRGPQGGQFNFQQGPGGPGNQQRQGPNQGGPPQRQGPPGGGNFNQQRQGPPGPGPQRQGPPNQRQGPPQGGPNQNQGGPNQNQGGPNQGGPNQQRPGPHGGPNQQKQGPQGGPNQGGPNQSPQGGPNQQRPNFQGGPKQSPQGGPNNRRPGGPGGPNQQRPGGPNQQWSGPFGGPPGGPNLSFDKGPRQFEQSTEELPAEQPEEPFEEKPPQQGPPTPTIPKTPQQDKPQFNQNQQQDKFDKRVGRKRNNRVRSRDRDRFPKHNFREDNFYPRDDFNNRGPPPHIVDQPERNDCEIIVVSKQLTKYAEYIEQRLKSLGLLVDLLFPNEDVPIGRVLANISSRGCLFAILVTPINEEHRSLTLNILHGLPQEHRNMPSEDAFLLMMRNFDAYMRGDKTVSETLGPGGVLNLSDRHPTSIQLLLNLLAENRQLSASQYDKLLKYLQDKKELQTQHEIAEGVGQQESQESDTKQTELQNRIMNILNKSAETPMDEEAKESAPQLLHDPSVQKALDSLLVGDMFKSITGTD